MYQVKHLYRHINAGKLSQEVALPSAHWRTMPSINMESYSLRPLLLSDADAWFSYLSLAQVAEHTSWNVTSSRDLLGLIGSYNHANVDASIRFAIVHTLEPAIQNNLGNKDKQATQPMQHSQNLIGSIGFHSVSDANKTAEIAYDLHPDFWHKGLMSHCCDALVKWGFQERGLLRIQATVLPDNVASISVLKKSGFEYEGRLRQLKKVRGVSQDFLMFSKIEV